MVSSCHCLLQPGGLSFLRNLFVWMRLHTSGMYHGVWKAAQCTYCSIFTVGSTGQQYHHNVERRGDSSPEQLLVKCMLARLENDTRLPQLKIKSMLISDLLSDGLRSDVN